MSDLNKKQRDAVDSLYLSLKKALSENVVLKAKLSVATEGLEVLLSDGNMNGIPQKTLEAMKSYDKELPQDTNTEKDKEIE